MKFSTQIAVAAVSLSLMGVGVARADTVLNYSFSADTYYSFSGATTPDVTGGFSYDVSTGLITNVSYTRGPPGSTTSFTSGALYPGLTTSDPTEVYFGTFGGNYDVYQLHRSLALGGTDKIDAVYHPSQGVYGGGSVIEAGAAGVPEPASWALMLMGFGLVGYAVRGRKFGAAIRHAH